VRALGPAVAEEERVGYEPAPSLARSGAAEDRRHVRYARQDLDHELVRKRRPRARSPLHLRLGGYFRLGLTAAAPRPHWTTGDLEDFRLGIYTFCLLGWFFLKKNNDNILS
jgi:hypothetical protein